MEINRRIILIDAVLIIGSLLVIAGIVGYTQAFAVAPLEDIDSVIFVLNNVEYLFIDDNLDFLSPELINLNEDVLVSLPSGHYYFKIIGERNEIRELTFEFDIDILFDLSDNEIKVINYGSKNLDVSVYNHGTFEESKLVLGDRDE
jgi:hypothetical protein